MIGGDEASENGEDFGECIDVALVFVAEIYEQRLERGLLDLDRDAHVDPFKSLLQSKESLQVDAEIGSSR
jgi:hypothetical protein